MTEKGPMAGLVFSLCFDLALLKAKLPSQCDTSCAALWNRAVVLTDKGELTWVVDAQMSSWRSKAAGLG